MTPTEKTPRERTVRALPARIYGYTDRQSVAHGQTIKFFISNLHGTDSVRLPIRIIRLGLTETEVDSGVAAVHASPVPATRAWENNSWSLSYATTIDRGWRPGVYIARVNDGTATSEDIYFVVRDSRRESPMPMVIQLPTTTINAYNNWGGASLYGYNSQPFRAHSVSFNRPQQSDALWPRGYGFVDEWKLRIKAFVQWMEAVGYQADFVTNNDLHEDSALLGSCRLFISIGHDEYWSREMRRHFDVFIESGGNAAILGGNTCYWQIRLDPDEKTGAANRLQTCYKNPQEQPNTDLGPKTGTWRDAGYSENMSFGAGVASGAWRGVGRDLGTFTVFRPDHWAFSGTELRRGDRFGHAADERLLSYETNGVDYILDNRGNPVPTGSDGTPTNYLVLALADLPFWATPGNAAMGIFTSPRSGGTVFNAATTDWARGLEACVSSGDLLRTVTARITHNVIARLSGT